ncbi:MAG: hypothetical protein ACP5US_03550 [Candidatus Kryptoniota bacterium]
MLYRLLTLIAISAVAYGQSAVLNGEYIIGARASSLSAFTADPDPEHAVALNPAKLSEVSNLYLTSDYEYQKSLNDMSSSNFLRMRSGGAAFHAGYIGIGTNYSYFEFNKNHTELYEVGVGFPAVFGVSLGITGKYISFEENKNLGPAYQNVIADYKWKKFVFDVGLHMKDVLASNMFFNAVINIGATYDNINIKGGVTQRYVPDIPVSLSQTFPDYLPEFITIGGQYSFISNYRLADFEMFRFSFAVDYSHRTNNSPTVYVDKVEYPRDIYRLGFEGQALGVLSVRIGYVLAAPEISGKSFVTNVPVAQAGTGFSYGFSLRFPIRLVLPQIPLNWMEVYYSKSPGWTTSIDHNLFGVSAQMEI